MKTSPKYEPDAVCAICLTTGLLIGFVAHCVEQVVVTSVAAIQYFMFGGR